MGGWVFEELRGAAVRRGPQEALLFKTEQTAEGEYAGNDHLVREVLQNSIDARVGNQPVRVRFAIHEANDAPEQARLWYYFERLREALERRVSYTISGIPEIPCRFLVCEDFQTRGLEGSTLLFSDPAPSANGREDFYWFWRNIGRSGKTGLDLGRWGLGKTVFRAVSRIGCMFGMTIRHSDRKKLLMGQSVLQVHRRGGRDFQPEGYWCGTQDANSGLPLPEEHEDALHQFSREWKLTRENEPGTSVVSPFIPNELKADRLLQAVAVGFFARILRGEMEVEVYSRELGSQLLSRETIERVCTKINWDGSKRNKRHASPPIAFAKRCLAETPSAVTEILGQKKLPELNESALSAETLAALRQDFNSGVRVALRVRMRLLRKQGPDKDGQLDVYLQRMADGEKCDTYYVREGMTITKINSRAATRAIQALVNVDAGPLAELLGDTEGPAHEDWDTSEDRPEQNWKTWKGRVNFVRKVVDNVVELLTPPSTAPDFDLLSDFFAIEKTEGPTARKTAGDKAKERPAFPELPYEAKWYQITQRAGGFTVSRNSQVALPPVPSLTLSVAYDLPRGNPLRNWSSFDFEIGDSDGQLNPKGKGVKAKKIAGNCLSLHDFEDGFHFSIDGFDRNRDLYVRLDE